jgi:hypothetical protein
VLDGRYVYLPTERRDGDGVYGMYWDRLAGADEETARSRLRRRAGTRVTPDPPSDDQDRHRRDICRRTGVDLDELGQQQLWRRVPNLPGVRQLLPGEWPSRVDRSTWPAELLAQVEAAETRMRNAVAARRRQPDYGRRPDKER